MPNRVNESTEQAAERLALKIHLFEQRYCKRLRNDELEAIGAALAALHRIMARGPRGREKAAEREKARQRGLAIEAERKRQVDEATYRHFFLERPGTTA